MSTSIDFSSTTKHNKQVMQTLVDEVLKDPENSYDKETVARKKLVTMCA